MTQAAPSLARELSPTREGALRLNLGGRERPIPGFKIVDLFEGPGIDIKWDCSDLSFAEDHSVDEIYASHILEHWPHTKTVKVLREWHRVLKPRGVAHISVPDLDAAFKLYAKFGFNDFLRNLMYGDQIYDLAFHYTIFTFATLASALIKAGFQDVQRIENMPYDVNDCSTNIDNFTRKPISVNVRAVA